MEHDELNKREEALGDLPSLGKEFRDQREANNVSIEQAAVELHIDKRYIQAIENDDFSAIGKRVFIRGYVRNYARYLDLNENLIEEMLVPHLAVAQDLNTKFSLLNTDIHGAERLDYNKAQLNLKSGAEGRKPALLRLWIGLFFLMVLVGGGMLIYVYFSNDKLDPQPIALQAQDDNGLQVSETVEVLLPRQPAQPALQPRPVPIMERAPTMDTDQVQQQATSEAVTAQPLEQENDFAATSVEEVNLVADDGPDVLQFEIEENNWIEVRRPDGALVVSRLFNSGENPVMRVHLPVDIIVGNAVSARLLVNGAYFDLENFTRNNVARLRVRL